MRKVLLLLTLFSLVNFHSYAQATRGGHQSKQEKAAEKKKEAQKVKAAKAEEKAKKQHLAHQTKAVRKRMKQNSRHYSHLDSSDRRPNIIQRLFHRRKSHSIKN